MNWKNFCEWLSNFLTSLKKALDLRGIANASIIVGEKVREGVVQIKHLLFYKEDGKWIQETTKFEVIEGEVPPHIRAKISAQEADITQEMELGLGISIQI